MRYLVINFLLVMFIYGVSFAQEAEKKEVKNEKPSQEKSQKINQKFIDLDGDGFNDNAPDHDGDGIPNGLDPDWQKQDEKFVDLDGDGINDTALGQQSKNRKQTVGPNEPGQTHTGTPQVKSAEQKQQQSGKNGRKK